MIDYIEKLLAADTVDEVWDQHLARMGTYGFDRVLYGLSFELGETPRGGFDDLYLLTNLPRQFTASFIGDGLYRDTPLARWAARETGALAWPQAMPPGPGEGRRGRALADLMRRHGLSAGYAISFGVTPPCGRSLGLLIARRGLSQSEVDAVWQEHGRVITLMNRAAHLKIAALPRAGAHRLTPRQREVLQLVGSGHTMPEIARRLKLQVVTVEKHLRLARELLGAETSAEAVLKAAVTHHIYVPEPGTTRQH
ncbi:MAG: LuxR family transcriptional regulator [Pseudomonadota bacterium]